MRRDKFTNLDRLNKLSTKCEGPYKFIKFAAPKPYYRENIDDIWLPHPFHVEHLSRFVA